MYNDLCRTAGSLLSCDCSSSLILSVAKVYIINQKTVLIEVFLCKSKLFYQLILID
jgi:hypothetical protein